MRSVHLDDDLYHWLADQAEPFESASDVIRRAVGLGNGIPGNQQPGKDRRDNRKRRSGEEERTHISSDLILPIEHYYVPLLRAVAERGGKARRKEVIAAVGEALDGKLTPHDREETRPGRIRWRGRVGWARQGLVWAGYLVDDPDNRGVWELTDKGRNAAETGELPDKGRLRTRRDPADSAK